MYQRANEYLGKYLHKLLGVCGDSDVCHSQCRFAAVCNCRKRVVTCLTAFALLASIVAPTTAQEKSTIALERMNTEARQQTQATTATRSVTLADAVEIFLQHN